MYILVYISIGGVCGVRWVTDHSTFTKGDGIPLRGGHLRRCLDLPSSPVDPPRRLVMPLSFGARETLFSTPIKDVASTHDPVTTSLG